MAALAGKGRRSHWPIAGAPVDRWNRKLVMVVADGVVALVTVGLVVDFWSGQVQVWHVILAMFLRSAAGSFQYPAWQASTSLMAPAEHLARIQGFNQMLAGAMNICAAPLGALLISFHRWRRCGVGYPDRSTGDRAHPGREIPTAKGNGNGSRRITAFQFRPICAGLRYTMTGRGSCGSA
jgi:MFS family permease